MLNDHRPGPGDTIGDRYRLIARLGSGGMADVFRAEDLRLDRQVAVKVFRADLADAVDPQRTAREAHLLAGLGHPTVVGVLDASSSEARIPYLVMELVEGRDLGALLTAGPPPTDLTRRIVADVADALALLHARSVVHRDVKPANILVLGDAERDRTGVTAKLTDFGIARLVDGTRLTTSDSILGTAAYLSPEQVRGGAVGPASDVYSLGLVLIECLTGERAFPGPATEAAVARLTRPPAVPGSTSARLAALLARMTALDPAARPLASEVAETLRGPLAGAMTEPEAVTTAPVPVVAPVPAALVGEPGTATGASDVPADAAAGEEVRHRRHPVLPAALGALAVVLAAGLAVFASASLAHAPAGHLAPVASLPVDGVTAGSPAARTAAPSRSSTGPARSAPSADSPTPTRAPTSTPTPSISATPAPAASTASPASPAPTASAGSVAPSSPSPASSASSAPAAVAPTATPEPQ